MATSSPFELRLSHAADWVRCGAFVRVSKSEQAAILENAGDNTVREEGTAMHWAAQFAIVWGRESLHDGMIADNGVVLTDELIDGALFYVDVLASHGDGWYIEQTLPAPRIHAKCGGTPDAFRLTAIARAIHVADLKGGYVPVDVFPNWQLIGYLAAVLDAHPGYDNDSTEVTFSIIQPRAFHRAGPVREHTMRVGDVRPYIAQLSTAAHVAMGDSAPATAGRQCDNCNGRVGCAVAHAAAGRAIEMSGEPDMYDLPPVAIDYEMQRLAEAAAMIEARLTGLEAQAMQLIRKGVTLPNFALESGAGRLKWNNEDAERAAMALGELMGQDLRKPQRAITPTQAAKMLSKEMFELYASRQRGETKLVRFDRNAAVKAFSHLRVESK